MVAEKGNYLIRIHKKLEIDLLPATCLLLVYGL